MKDFFEFIASRPYIGLILILLIAATVVMWIKAAAASQRHREFRDAEIARIEKEKALRNDYKVITDSTFDTDDKERLLFGIAANIQMFLEKQDDMNAAFFALPEEKRLAYSLSYVFEDSGDSELSKFFKSNGQPLTGEAEKAVKKIIGGKFHENFSAFYRMTDDDCEDVSYDEKKSGEFDKAYSEIMRSEKSDIFSLIADYLKSNKDIFIN